MHPPMLSLRMGSSLNPRDIKEGDDVYFECHIRANPQVHKLAWYHNGLLLHHNRSAGVILSNQSLVLQKVSRPSAGNYSCRASNVQGEGTSNHVLLDIMCKSNAPACQSELSGTDAPIIIAASRSEDVNITCEMDALPDRLKFQWTHTNTVGENSELESDMYTSLGSKSLLRYHLRSEEDFGTLLCWAHNSIGAAERPCVYQLVPADVPQPVENCSIINRTSTSVEITCEPGFDGGLPQSFLLEAYQTSPTERRGLLYNITFDRPAFSLSRLDADGTFHFKIYSVNRKGRSSASIMDGIVLHYPAMQSGKWT
ncbi:Hemicentin-1 [Orchesella cincta]|uniref:Hemicentin-1 n=1 Tax=Orchesella cincta TaxID=48709 RepID=A0A1D2N1Z9_ORCCI|nr:Hemicentin-1 [Orchesella cincta]